MLPIVLTANATPVICIGAGRETAGRVALCQAAGLAPLHVYAPRPQAALTDLRNIVLRRRYPKDAELAQARVVFVGDLSQAQSTHWAQKARMLGVLVNVEDKTELCDFYMPALVRRGDLLLAVSTSGASPALASLLKAYLAKRFSPVWGKRVARIRAMRQQALAAGQNAAAIRAQTASMVAGWLK